MVKNSSVKEAKELPLDEIIYLAHKIGVEYVEKRREAEELELMRNSVRSQIMNRLEADSAEKIAEAKLKRLAEAHSDYIEHVRKLAFVRGEAEKLRVRYDSYRNLFDARKTMLNYKRLEMKSL